MTALRFRRALAVGICLAALAALAGVAFGADGADGETGSTAPASSPAPASAPASASATSPPPATPARASWTSDRIPIEVGQIVTVMVDEQTSARERVSRVATAQRSQLADLRAQADGDGIGPTGVASILDGDSRDIGEAHRQGDLVTSVSARVVAIDEHGIARIEGSKEVSVDGRKQQVMLSGSIRTADIPSSNIIYSERIADLQISYKGKKLAPRAGILGRILSMLWP